MSWLRLLPRLPRFGLFYLREIILSNLRVARDVAVIALVRLDLVNLVQASLGKSERRSVPDLGIRPGVVAMPLDVQGDFQIFLVANLITMTPGTLSIDVSSDRRVLYVHCMYIRDVEAMKRELKDGIEAEVIRLFRP